MGRQMQNKLLVNLGSVLAANGAILLFSPARFAQLRTSAWTPDALDDALGRLSGNKRLGRGVGTALIAVGVAMIRAGVIRTRPLS